MNAYATATAGGEMANQEMITRVLSLLGGPVRLDLIRSLAAGPRPVGQLAEEAGQSIGLVSHNLRLLREAGLVICTPKSRQRIYSLSPMIRVQSTQKHLDLCIQVKGQGKLTLSLLPTDAPQPDQASSRIEVGSGLTSKLANAASNAPRMDANGCSLHSG